MTTKRKQMQRILPFVLAAILLAFFCAAPASGNAAAPPHVVIIVEQAPEDLSLFIDGEEVFAQTHLMDSRTYYAFWQWYEVKEANLTLTVNQGTARQEVPLQIDPGQVYQYFALDPTTMTLASTAPADYILWDTAKRLTVTLLLEGLLFFLLGFRKKRSWTAFFLVNLATQAFLAYCFYSNFTPFHAYAGFTLILAEGLIIIVESLVMVFAVKEKTWKRRLLYAVSANVLSWWFGGWLLPLL